MTNNLHIGVLRLSQFATDFYIDSIENKAKLLGKTLTFTQHKVDFEEWNAHLPYGFDFLKPRLEKALFELDSEEIDFLIIPNITLHFTLDKLELPSSLKNKIIHPIQETIQNLKRQKITEISLLATRHTMQSESMKAYFNKHNIEMKTLSPEVIKQVDNLRTTIFNEGVKPIYIAELKGITEAYPYSVLACTELSLVNQNENVIDMVQTQISRCFQ